MAISRSAFVDLHENFIDKLSESQNQFIDDPLSHGTDAINDQSIVGLIHAAFFSARRLSAHNHSNPVALPSKIVASMFLDYGRAAVGDTNIIFVEINSILEMIPRRRGLIAVMFF